MGEQTIEELQRKINEMTRIAPSAQPMPVMPSPAQQPQPMQSQPAYPPPAYPAPMYPPPAMPQALGFAVPMSVRTPGGEVTVSVQFGPEWAASPQAAEQLIGMLMAAGWPVKAWQPKPNGAGGGGRQWGGGRY